MAFYSQAGLFIYVNQTLYCSVILHVRNVTV